MSEVAIDVDRWVDRWVRSSRALRPRPRTQPRPEPRARHEESLQIAELRGVHVDRIYRRLRREALAGRVEADELPAALDLMICAYEPGSPHVAVVAERASGWPVGMVSVLQVRPGVGVIRHLWIDRRWRTAALAHRMIERALRQAWERGMLKVVLERPRRLRRIRAVFEKCGYRFGRRRRVNGRPLIEFYCDLYRRVDEPRSSVA